MLKPKPAKSSFYKPTKTARKKIKITYPFFTKNPKIHKQNFHPQDSTPLDCLVDKARNLAMHHDAIADITLLHTK